jgi:starch synthase (maltosyl-transferring)
LQFHPVDNEHIIAYSKRTADGSNIVVTVVNLDPRRTHAGVISLPMSDWGYDRRRASTAEDLLSGDTVSWAGNQLSVALDPKRNPAMIFRLDGPNAGRRRR